MKESQHNKLWSTLMAVGFMLAFLAAGTLQGCKSPRAQWAVARESLTQTENALVSAHQSHLLDDKSFIATEPYVKAVRNSLTKADEELILSHDQPTKLSKFYLDSAAAALPPLQKVTQTKP